MARYIVFASIREGNGYAIWRADSRNGGLKRLTYGQDDFTRTAPRMETGWFITVSSRDTQMLEKVSIEGGTPSVLAEGEYYGARFSPDNKAIAAYDCTNNVCTIRIFSSDGRSLKLFPLAPHGTLNYWDYSMLHWTPDGRALTYPLLDGDAMNLWRQPLSGGPPQQMTHFKELIFAYDWSADGKQLAITRGSKPSDVVLISNFRE